MGKITKVRPYKHYSYGEAIQIIEDRLTEAAGVELVPTEKGDELVAIPSAEVRREIEKMKRRQERVGPTAEDFIYRINKDRELRNLYPAQKEHHVKTTEEIEEILMKRAQQQIISGQENITTEQKSTGYEQQQNITSEQQRDSDDGFER